jgi:uncharacterized membrane protein (DUF4010 family)
VANHVNHVKHDYHADMSSYPLDALYPYLTSLAIGLLIGLERERNPSAKAGLRTFALVALAGTLGAMLSSQTGAPWVLGAGLLIFGGMMVSAHFRSQPAQGSDVDPGTTTVAAVVVCYGLGAMIWFGHVQIAVTLAILTTMLLYFKAELKGVSQTMTRRDLLSILQFAVLSFVVLPILPNESYGPYDALNPYQIWWMVVLISGLSLAGYAALRFAGQRHGALLTGIFGGVASSTATTLAFSRHGRANPGFTPLASVVILTANWVVLIRLTVVVGVVAPALFADMIWVLAGGMLAGLVWLVLAWRKLDESTSPDLSPVLELGNPTEIRMALSFGLLYAAVLLATAWLTDWAGQAGTYAVALVSGSTDIDAITLSSLRLLGMGTLSAHTAVTAILLGLLANMTFKTGLTLVLGGLPLAKRVMPGMLAVALGCIAGYFISGYFASGTFTLQSVQ